MLLSQWDKHNGIDDIRMKFEAMEANLFKQCTEKEVRELKVLLHHSLYLEMKQGQIRFCTIISR